MSGCEFRDRVMRYHDGELAPAERREVIEHLARCPDCSRELDGLRALTRLLTDLQAAPMPEAALRRLHEGVGRTGDRVIARICRPVALAAAMVLVACALWLHFVRPSPVPEASLPAGWERAAVTLNADTARADSGTSLALWMADNLSGENGQ